MRPPLESPTEPSNAPLTSEVCAQQAEASPNQIRSRPWRSRTFLVYSVKQKESDRAVAFTKNLNANIQRLKLDVVTIAPLHGFVVPFAELEKLAGKGTT
jgi:hypothetical protein